jgi:bifunctional ADP-heptose synthase (sugar kinase/adenylyltransferase)
VHCKGADYAPPHGKPIPERAVVEAYGGRVAFLPLVPGLSTSQLIQRIRLMEDSVALEDRFLSSPAAWKPDA